MIGGPRDDILLNYTPVEIQNDIRFESCFVNHMGWGESWLNCSTCRSHPICYAASTSIRALVCLPGLGTTFSSLVFVLLLLRQFLSSLQASALPERPLSQVYREKDTSRMRRTIE